MTSPSDEPGTAATALITGASSGIGRAAAIALARRGHRVALVARDETRLRAVREEILALGGRASIHVCDLTATERVVSCVAEVEAQCGPIDWLVSCAGYDRDFGRISTAEPGPDVIGDLERVVDVDLLATARVAFCVEPGMRARRRGAIVSLAATPLLDHRADHAIYQIARAGVVAMTQVFARQHELQGLPDVRAYCLVLGNVRNPSTFAAMSPEQRADADSKGWLDSAHVGEVVTALLERRLDRADGALIRLDAGTARGLFAEIGRGISGAGA